MGGAWSAWGEGNFDNDGAKDFLSMQTMQLTATITAVAGDASRLKLNEDGETLFMPSVELLALLCERYNAEPPRPAVVRQWRDKYLQVYDRGIDRLKTSAEFKAGRRKAIEKTFRWLESLADSFWSS
ncbi:MAG TPA: DUF4259 domain-containing protein [Gemmataceae bacterium]|nr:DUF4259 domain-containing protein [Gemmataceae bacterium]